MDTAMLSQALFTQFGGEYGELIGYLMGLIMEGLQDGKTIDSVLNGLLGVSNLDCYQAGVANISDVDIENAGYSRAEFEAMMLEVLQELEVESPELDTTIICADLEMDPNWETSPESKLKNMAIMVNVLLLLI